MWQRSVDAPVTVRDVSPNADGDVIPEGSQIKMPLISMEIPWDSRSALGIRMQSGDKTNEFASRVVRGTSPDAVRWMEGLTMRGAMPMGNARDNVRGNVG